MPAQRGSIRGANAPAASPHDRAAVIREAAAARTALHEAAGAASRAAAQALSLAEILDEALAAFIAAETTPGLVELPSSEAPREACDLSPREREVLALVAAGRTNKAIAEALYVSPNTVKTHVASLLHKLGAETRVQLATLATKHELRQLVSAGADGDFYAVDSSRPRR